ncbi:MAG: hypothetical protein QOJ54_2566, partial [Aliidongia sp.]|nr:hypothetical protein [Aliidongia sp.]
MRPFGGGTPKTKPFVVFVRFVVNRRFAA